MNAQSTLEFLILLSVAASLAVVALAAYQHVTSVQRPVYASLANQGQQPFASATLRGVNAAPSMHTSIANVSYVNRSNALNAVVVAPAGSIISYAYVNASGGAVVMPNAYTNVSAGGIAVLQFSIIPNAVGPVRLQATARVTHNGNTTVLNAYAETYTINVGSTAPAQQSPAFSAALERHNESILYNLGAGSSVYTAKMWDHCSLEDWGYHQLPIQDQCGGAKWYFFTFDSWCYWNRGDAYRTYCVALQPSGTASRQILNTQSYAYNTTLSLYNATLRLGANLSDSGNASALTDGAGRTHGSASVLGVSGVGPQPYGSYIVLNESGAERAVNMSYYNAYEQALNALEAGLHGFNKTDGDPGAAQQYISALNLEAGALVGAPAATNNYCHVAARASSSYYACAPLSGLYYVINASVSPAPASAQSIQVQGSTVNVG